MIRRRPNSPSPKARRTAAADAQRERKETPFSKTVVAVVCLALVIATFAIYARTFGYGFVSYDDSRYVYANPILRAGLTGANLAWALTTYYFQNWCPLTWISYMADVQFFGIDAGEMHAVNVLLHVAATLLLFLALVRMTRQPWRCALAAGLFALHPIHVESVAWIADRKDVLSGLFAALTLFFYAGYARAPSVPRYISVALAFALSLMAKTTAVTLPFALLLLDFWPLGRLGPPLDRFRFRRAILEKVPLIALAAIAGALTVLAQRHAVGALERLPLSVRLSNAVVFYIGYMAKAVWPAGLAPFYPPHPQSLASVFGAAAVLLAVTAAAVIWVRRCPGLLIGWLWYLGMLLPAIGFVQQLGDQVMADRYTYLPMIGLSIAAVWTAAGVAAQRPWMLRTAAVASLLYLAALSVAAARQAAYWADSRTLYEHALAVTEGNYVMANDLGELLEHEDGPSAEAAAMFRKSIAFAPNHASAHLNLGRELMKAGQLSGARAQIVDAARLDPSMPLVQESLGVVLVASDYDKYQKARRCLDESLRLDPVQPEAHDDSCNIGIRLIDTTSTAGDVQAEAQNDTCNILLYFARPEEAATHCTDALKARPGYTAARVNLARALAREGRKADAERELNLALHNHPADAIAREALLDLQNGNLR